MAEEGQDLLETVVPPAAGPGSPGAAAALRGETPAAAASQTRAAAKTPKSTEYVVFYSETREGPFTLVGTFVAQGQQNAKREGAKTVGAEADDGIEAAEKYFFMAVPTSSFRPEKPSITLQITFATEDSADVPDDEE